MAGVGTSDTKILIMILAFNLTVALLMPIFQSAVYFQTEPILQMQPVYANGTNVTQAIYDDAINSGSSALNVFQIIFQSLIGYYSWAPWFVNVFIIFMHLITVWLIIRFFRGQGG
jgi:hypothetical protein